MFDFEAIQHDARVRTVEVALQNFLGAGWLGILLRGVPILDSGAIPLEDSIQTMNSPENGWLGLVLEAIRIVDVGIQDYFRMVDFLETR